MLKRTLSLILLTVLVLTSFVIPAYADSAIGEIGTEEMQPIDQEERIPLKDSYTEEEIQAILSGDHNFDIPEEGIKFSSENFPLAVDENVVSPDVVGIIEDDYYITVLSSGRILGAPKSNYIITFGYSESDIYKWVFEEVDTFTYTIRNKLSPDICLAASPSSSGDSALVTKTYSSTDVTCHWSMSITSNGNYIQSEAIGTNADGQYLYLSGSQFVLSSSNRTYIGLVNADDFVPCTSLTFKETYYSTYITGKTSALGIKEGTPTGANYLGNLYITYTISDTDVCTINSSKQLVGVSIGEATVTATHKMTGATGTVKVHVGYPTKVKVYYDNAFASVCSSTSTYSNTPAIQIEKWFEDVQKKYAENYNIHIILVSTTLFTSYPETSDANGNMICANGATANDECECLGTCENSIGFDDSNVKDLHHKNLSNIFARAPSADVSKSLHFIFTGHNTCRATTSSCIDSQAGISSGLYDGMAISTVNSYNGVDGVSQNKIKRTIVHEIGHWFGALDHGGSDSLPSYQGLTPDSECIYSNTGY